MFRLPIYGNKTLRLAFEFGLVLSEVAKEKGVTITSDISSRAEKILLNELKTNGFEKTALNFVPLVLASFEVK
jgi:hypothetical protein